MFPERNCSRCTRQIEYGCNATVDEDGVWKDKAFLPIQLEEGEESWVCPRRPLKDEPEKWSSIMFFYGMYKKNILPDDGALVGQASKAMDIFSLLDSVTSECKETLEEDTRVKM